MITKSFVSYLLIILRKILRSSSSSNINESADASNSKFFICREKKPRTRIKKKIVKMGCLIIMFS